MTSRPKVPGLSREWAEHQLDLLELVEQTDERTDDRPDDEDEGGPTWPGNS
jgi:hypothetical protein